jgi:SAM-dependent methyltransferase
MFGSRLGTSFLAEASDLARVTDKTYDFVLASHVLEHVANPLRARHEWKRVVRNDGTVLLIVPHKSGTFDHRRSFTSLEHIQNDFRTDRDEGDMTHLEEVVRMHDLELDPPAGTAEQFRERCLRNAEIRGMHHHVFSPETLVSMVTLAGLSVLNLTIERPFHIVLFAQRADSLPTAELERENAAFTRSDACWRLREPFPEREIGVHGSPKKTNGSTQ